MTKYFVTFAIAALAACGSGDKDKGGGDKKGGGGDDKVASCNQAKIHSCREYRGGNLAIGTDSLKKLCSAIEPGDFTDKPCPTEKLVGSCAKPEGKDFFYEGYPIPAADAEKQCKDSGGSWAK